MFRIVYRLVMQRLADCIRLKRESNAWRRGAHHSPSLHVRCVSVWPTYYTTVTLQGHVTRNQTTSGSTMTSQCQWFTFTSQQHAVSLIKEDTEFTRGKASVLDRVFVIFFVFVNSFHYQNSEKSMKQQYETSIIA